MNRRVSCRSSVRGVSIAIDDFGTGYSSLAYLRRYPADRVKIAKEFVAEISSEPGSATIVKAIAALARDLGMVAIAEGIENSEQLEIVATCLCPEAQGFYFSRPLVPREIFSLLRRGRIEGGVGPADAVNPPPRLSIVAGR